MEMERCSRAVYVTNSNVDLDSQSVSPVKTAVLCNPVEFGDEV